MTKRLSLTQFQHWMTQATPELQKAGVRGMRKAGLFLHRTVVIEISQTKPRAAVDTGELRNSVNATPVPDGALVSVDAPHAPVLEYGRRPNSRMPPIQPIMDWMRRTGAGRQIIDTSRKRIARQAIKTIGRSAAIQSMRADKSALQEAALRSAAFVMARAIAKNGIAPRHYFAKAWTRSESMMVNQLLLEIAKTGWKPTAEGRAAIRTMFKNAKKGSAA